jgi:hypothetical protein
MYDSKSLNPIGEFNLMSCDVELGAFKTLDEMLYFDAKIKCSSVINIHIVVICYFSVFVVLKRMPCELENSTYFQLELEKGTYFQPELEKGTYFQPVLEKGTYF